MFIDQQAKRDYERAVSRGFWRKVLARFTGSDNKLLPFDEVRQRLEFQGQHDRGLQTVEISAIIGSQGRYLDFDRAFLPTQDRTKDRWISIDKAHYEDIHLPPVDLYKVGDGYFIKDGHHRISVAHQHGQLFVDAYVTEMDASVNLTPHTTLQEFIQKQDYEAFIAKTRLDVLRPDVRIRLTVPGLFGELLQHIDVHRYYLAERQEDEVSYEQAVLSWCDNVYRPMVEIIRDQGILRGFPGRTETDLYLWVITHRWYLRQAYGNEVTLEEAAEEFSDRYASGIFRRVINRIKVILGLG